MKTSSAPRSSSVNPLLERSTSAFSELSAVAVGTAKQAKNHQTISAKYIENSDVGPVEFSFYKDLLSSIFSLRKQELCANSNMTVSSKIPV